MVVFTSLPRAYNIFPLTLGNYTTWNIKVEMLLIHSYWWNVIDDNEMDHSTIDCVAHLAWKSKDFKACDDILFHCGKKINLSWIYYHIQSYVG